MVNRIPTLNLCSSDLHILFLRLNLLLTALYSPTILPFTSAVNLFLIAWLIIIARTVSKFGANRVGMKLGWQCVGMGD